MTKRLILLIFLVFILGVTAVLVYTYPAEQTVSLEDPRKNTKITEWKREALNFFSEEKMVPAELIAQKILRAAPNDPDARHLLTLIRSRSADFSSAEELCRRALRFAPDDAAAHNNLGVLLFRRGEMQEGFRELSVAAVLLPEEPVIRWNCRTAEERLTGKKVEKKIEMPQEHFPLMLLPDK